MVKLNFNPRGYLYQDGLKSLRAAFASASEGIERECRRTYDAIDAHDAAVAKGADPQIERDDNGLIVDDYRDHLIYHSTVAEEARTALNKAFAITIFHQWERAARDWTGKPNGKFVTLCAAVAAKGYPVSPKLAELHVLANLLKHANSKWGVQLQALRTDFFRQSFDASLSKIDWYEEVELSNEHVGELFETVAASGPNPQTK